jgi:imidazolonepropionase-like amidohydrolase
MNRIALTFAVAAADTLPEAIAACTSSGAYLLQEDDERGTIADGKRQ